MNKWLVSGSQTLFFPFLRLLVEPVTSGAARVRFNSLTAELNPICHLLALLGAHHIFHISGLRVNDEGAIQGR